MLGISDKMEQDRLVIYTTKEHRKTLENIQKAIKQEYDKNISYSKLTNIAIQTIAKLSTKEIIEKYNEYMKIR